MAQVKRTAILFHGMLRSYRIASTSVKRKLIRQPDTDIFFFGPNYTDRPDKFYESGLQDSEGFFIKNPKEAQVVAKQADREGFVETYQDFLRSYLFHSFTPHYFEDLSLSLRPREDWLMGLNPARMLSMFYNMQGVIDLFLKEANINDYGQVIITRTDLIFYNCPSADVGYLEVHIPSGQGFSDVGEQYTQNAPVYYYKNMGTGDFVPGGRTERFNDQIMIMSPPTLLKIRELYVPALELIKARVPLSPETILYILMKRHGIETITHPEWIYEIYRDGKKIIDSVMDTAELAQVDRYNPLIFKHRIFQYGKDLDTSICALAAPGSLYRWIYGAISAAIGSTKRRKLEKDPIAFLLDARKPYLRLFGYMLLFRQKKDGTHFFRLGRGLKLAASVKADRRHNIIIDEDSEFCALFGPNRTFRSGHYKAQFKVSDFHCSGYLLVEVVAAGDEVIADIAYNANDFGREGFLSIEWQLGAAKKGVEIRLKTFSKLQACIHYLVIKKLS